MEPKTHAALVAMAGRVAEQLVACALRDMCVGDVGPVTVTIHPQTSAPRQLTDGRPPKRKYTKRAKAKTVKPPKPGSWKAKVAAVNSIGKRPAKAGHYAATALSERKCRGCQKAGTAQRVAGTEKTVKCSACGHLWDVRGLSNVSTSAPSRTVAGKVCRCDHDQKHHVEYSGPCTTRGCSCSAFTAA